MRFWDTSAVVPLLVAQPASEAVDRQLAADDRLVAWWGTGLECRSAVARLERERLLDAAGVEAALAGLEAIEAAWTEIAATEAVRLTAARLLRTHALRAADALQLASAIVAADGDPRTLAFVTLDDRLALAAAKEGFPVVVPA